jgi:hypothetical protein
MKWNKGMSHSGLCHFTFKKYLKAKEELWKFKYLATQNFFFFIKKNEFWQLRKLFVTRERHRKETERIGTKWKNINDDSMNQSKQIKLWLYTVIPLSGVKLSTCV